MPPVAAPQAQAGAQKKKARNKRIAIITAIVCVVLAIAGAIGIFALTQYKDNVYRHEPTEVQFAFAYSGSAAEKPIGIPILIEGSDLDNNHVKEQVLATPESGDVSLLAGSYTISVAGNPVSANGTVYQVQGTNSQEFEVPVPNSGNAQPMKLDLNFSFEPIAADKVTDQQVEEIKNWMMVYGESSSEISQISTKIVQLRNQAVAAATLEKEKQAALASNPSTVTGDNKLGTSAPTYTFTGTVRTKYVSGTTPGMSGDVWYLELPNSIEVTGTQYAGVSSKNIILGKSYASYKDKVISISTRVGVESTASIPEAQVSEIHISKGATVTRTF